MEKCAHCHKIRDDKKNWKSFTARYHEVEIRHFVCPKCYALPFPRFYRLYEDSSCMRNHSTRISDVPPLHFRQSNQSFVNI
jgi:hypothetical protein